MINYLQYEKNIDDISDVTAKSYLDDKQSLGADLRLIQSSNSPSLQHPYCYSSKQKNSTCNPNHVQDYLNAGASMVSAMNPILVDDDNGSDQKYMFRKRNSSFSKHYSQ